MDVRVDHKKGWTPKNWCFQTVVLKNTLENPLNFKEIKRVNPKGNQPWIFIGRTDAEVKVPILWLHDAEFTQWKRPWCWRQRGKGWQKMGWLDSTTDSMDMNLSKLQEKVKNSEAWHAAVHRVTKNRENNMYRIYKWSTWLSQENGKVS